MALIDNEEAARRLARVIISDIELYEKKKIQAGDDLTGPMAEGRALFHRRVVPGLAAIFEAVVEAKRSGASTGGPTALTPPPLGMPPRPTATAAPAAPVPPTASTAPPDVDGAAATTVLGEPEVARTHEPAEGVAERVEKMGRAEEGERPPAKVDGTWAPEADAGEARRDDARPLDSVLSEATARTDLTAQAAATRNPDLPNGRMRAREASKDDQITPVQLEDIVAGRSDTTEAPSIGWAARPPEAPQEDSSQDQRVTSPVAFAAVSPTPEEPPIEPRPPAHTPVPSRAFTVAPPAAPLSAPSPAFGLAKAPTPQPIAMRREPPPVPREPADKTPVPLSVSLAAAPPPSARPPASAPLAPSPLMGLATIPPDALAPPPGPSAASDDVVNLRAKTSKVRVLFYIVATAGGLALIGRFLTRFL